MRVLTSSEQELVLIFEPRYVKTSTFSMLVLFRLIDGVVQLKKTAFSWGC